MIDRRLIRNFDFPLFLTLLALCGVGMVTLYSATHGLPEYGDPYCFVKKQALFLGIGLGLLFLVCLIDYINFYNWAHYLYAFNLLLLLAVLFLGKAAEKGGAMRWIPLGAFDLQPSEIAKVVLIITLARLLADREEKMKAPGDLFPMLIHTAVPMVLIFLQPDLGTALVFITLLLGLLYVAGARANHIAFLALGGAAISPVLWQFLQPYQKMRLLVFINPNMDPTNYGYQLLQSMIAIGSGGLLGKGFMGSTQVRLQFLPVHYTDFIFSVFGEEFGFAGAVLLLFLFFFLIYRIILIATQAKDRFGMLLCSGVAVILSFQVLVNIGMTISIMPVTGLPLPFMSYGNNALLVNLMAVGLVLNVGMRRHKIQF